MEEVEAAKVAVGGGSQASGTHGPLDLDPVPVSGVKGEGGERVGGLAVSSLACLLA